MRKVLITTLCGMILSFGADALAKTFIVESSFPTVGVINEIPLQPKQISDPSCEVGCITANEDGEILQCVDQTDEGEDTGEWEGLEYIWQQQDDNIFTLNPGVLVGIGTTNPLYDMHVVDQFGDNALINLESDESHFSLSPEDGRFSIIDNRAGKIRFTQNIKGNIGIGFTSPKNANAALVIKTESPGMINGANPGRAIHITKAGGETGASIGKTNDSDLLFVSGGSINNQYVRSFIPKTSGVHFNDGNIDFFTNDSETSTNSYMPAEQSRLHIDKNWNIGVGTTSPQERLHVNGDALFESLTVNNRFSLTPRQGNPSDWDDGVIGEIAYSEEKNKPLQFDGSAWGKVKASEDIQNPTIVKCQVFHRQNPKYPKCPNQWSSVHEYADSCIEFVRISGPGDEDAGQYAGMSERATSDNSWCYYDNDTPTEKLRRESTKSCTVCMKD